ncbi:MAG: sialate O-acetylesterase [Victivallales bacterium]|jgi:sialate O-acetylesterase
MRISFSALTVICLVFMANSMSAAETELRLQSLFSDNMVLQRDKAIPIRGLAEPGDSITVEFAGQKKTTAADKNGKWSVILDPLKTSSSPNTITVSSKIDNRQLEFCNVLVGDVWVCSGQSNMYWPVKDSLDSSGEIAAANYPAIRFFTVPRKAALQTQNNVEGKWVECSPTAVPGFSAVAYFFGREMQKASGVPVGLIHSSVGGTAIEPWLNQKGMENHPALRPMLDEMKLAAGDFGAAYGNYKQRMKDWEAASVWNNPDRLKALENCAGQDFDDSKWPLMKLPKFWEETGMIVDGLVWFRKTVEIPEKWEGRELLLSIGRVDDYDETYFNGTCVGKTDIDSENPWAIKREYRIPAKLVKKGSNLITVRATDVRGNGGMPGPADNMRIALADAPKGESIPLSGDWRYQIELQIDYAKVQKPPTPPAKPGDGGSPTELYNGMIAPLAKYPITGVIWYQGESNTGRPDLYRSLFPAMIDGWRQEWNQGNFPFLFVQLASYTRHTPALRVTVTKPSQPQESQWAELQEAQLMALSLPNTAMAVTVDIGDSFDIHPKNKQEVGRRLALAARHIVNGEKLVYSGPIYDSMKREGGKIRLHFKHVGGGLVAKGGPLEYFAIAGADRKFVWANAKIDGDTVLVWQDQVKDPTAVRYAWDGDPVGCNLFNSEGLPASPFRTDR